MELLGKRKLVQIVVVAETRLESIDALRRPDRAGFP